MVVARCTYARLLRALPVYCSNEKKKKHKKEPDFSGKIPPSLPISSNPWHNQPTTSSMEVPVFTANSLWPPGKIYSHLSTSSNENRSGIHTYRHLPTARDIRSSTIYPYWNKSSEAEVILRLQKVKQGEIYHYYYFEVPAQWKILMRILPSSR